MGAADDPLWLLPTTAARQLPVLAKFHRGEMTHPEQHHHQRAGCPEARRDAAAADVGAYDVLAPVKSKAASKAPRQTSAASTRWRGMTL